MESFDVLDSAKFPVLEMSHGLDNFLNCCESECFLFLRDNKHSGNPRATRSPSYSPISVPLQFNITLLSSCGGADV